MKKKDITNHVIWGLPHRKRKEKKADKLSGKLADVTTERFFFSVFDFVCLAMYLLNLH